MFLYHYDAGSIPSSISSASALTTLNLYSNKLTGETHRLYPINMKCYYHMNGYHLSHQYSYNTTWLMMTRPIHQLMNMTTSMMLNMMMDMMTLTLWLMRDDNVHDDGICRYCYKSSHYRYYFRDDDRAGSIPSSISSLSALVFLDLHRNKLTGKTYYL